MFREAFHLLETGVADAETIDRAFRNSVGLSASFCGPFRWIDLTGGPALYEAHERDPLLQAHRHRLARAAPSVSPSSAGKRWSNSRSSES